MKSTPPGIVLRFFRWYCKPRVADHIEGDLVEVYQRRVRNQSKTRADIRFIIDVLLLFRPGIIRRPHGFQYVNPFGMYRNYFKVTFRVLNRERLYSLINVFGLALGFTCCLLIYLFIADELSYDNFHHDSDRIYRISSAYMRQGQWEPYASNAWRTAELIQTKYPEIETLVRIMPDNNVMFEYNGKRILEPEIAWTDDNFFRLFNFPLVQGNPAEALKGPDKVVISESMAAKYFGNDNPIGKVFKVDDDYSLQVSGVMKDMPPNSHFHFSILASNETLRKLVSEQLFTHMAWDSQFVYARLAPGVNPAALEATFPDFIARNLNFFKPDMFKIFLQPLKKIHLESNIGREFEANGSMARVYTFSVIAIFVLVIACVNYMNLTTARSLRRAKEVGMRKVLGAKRSNLLAQFLTESFIITSAAVLLSLLAAELLLPAFNKFAGKAISSNTLLSAETTLGLLEALCAITVLAGFYPALVLSSFRPLSSIKTSAIRGTHGFSLRRALVVLQFVISIGLISASAIVFQQWTFLRNKPLGINKDMVLSIPLQTMDTQKLPVFARDLLANNAIKKVGFSNMRMPGWIGNSTDYKAQDVNTDEELNKSMKIIRVDYEFLPLIEAGVVEGRYFSNAFADSTSSLILNESAVAQLGWKDAVGKWIQLGDKRFTVVGVIKDFHFESLHRKIPPTIFVYSAHVVNWIYVKIAPENVSATLADIEKKYTQFVTNRDFTFTFLDQDIAQQYQAEQKFTEVFSIFTILAIIIACLGTFGLISFTAEQKSKEIGIRKVLGASVSHVSFLLIREFVVLLVIASAIAWPVAWYFLQGWIEGFIYRTSIGVVPFVLATFLAGLIVVVSTGFRALKAAMVNPIESLRDE